VLAAVKDWLALSRAILAELPDRSSYLRTVDPEDTGSIDVTVNVQGVVGGGLIDSDSTIMGVSYEEITVTNCQVSI